MCFFPPPETKASVESALTFWTSLFMWDLTSPRFPSSRLLFFLLHPEPLLIHSLSLFQDNSHIENHNPHIQTPFGRPVIHFTRLICLLA